MLSKENKNKYQPNEGAIFFFLFPYDETMVSKKSCAKVPGVGGGGRKCGLVFLFFVPSFRRLLLFFLKYLCSTFAMGVTRIQRLGGGLGKLGGGAIVSFFLLLPYGMNGRAQRTSPSYFSPSTPSLRYDVFL